MSALEAKAGFGRLLEAAQREPVMVTKDNREVAAMVSMQDFHEMGASFLAEPILADVEAGKLNVIEALMAQAKIDERVKAGLQAIAEGKGIVADDAWFDGLRRRIRARAKR